MNSFFDWASSLSRFVRFDAARADEVNSALDEVSAGFDDVEIKTNAAIKLPDGETSAALGNAAARIGKVLSFDATGQPMVINPPSGSGDVVTDAVQTLTNKTVALGSNTVSGTKAQFSTACSDGDFLFVGDASGDVVGPASSTDNAVARFDSTTGKLIQNSAFIVDDTGHVSSFGGNIKFPASQAASADANTLDDYEEGSWTPSQGAGLTVTGSFSSSGTYVKIGKQVTVIGTVSGSTSVAISLAGTVLCGNLPFSAANNGIGSVTNSNYVPTNCFTSTTNIFSGSIAAASTIYFTVTYFV
jgi:hypothetical protein